ncbi:MAG: hypothetical protein GXY81_08090 [Candidatus Cloacimonetes bacterium]|nr:hypothetical protein [Candidatus Cloacimonadota bacterium]
MIIAQRASAILYRYLRSYPDGCFILPANICPIVPLTFHKAGVQFEFFDISQEDLCLDETAVLDAINARPGHYTGVLFNHSYGVQIDKAPFFSRIASLDPSISIIADRCLCYPDFGPPAPNVSMELYSSGAKKAVDIGWGGYAKTADHVLLDIPATHFDPVSEKKIEAQIRIAVEQKMPLEIDDENWLNTDIPDCRFADYQAQIEASMQTAISHRSIINKIYDEYLPDHIKMAVGYQNWRYNIVTEVKDKILQTLFGNRLFASSHYLSANVLFRDQKEFPNTTNLSKQVINLFNDFHITEHQAKLACKLILELL